jgi:hypothetical protein
MAWCNHICGYLVSTVELMLMNETKKPRIKKINPAKTGVSVFLATLILGAVIFFGCGKPAGLFTGKDIIDSLTGSAAGWAALFGATLIIGSPIIGLSIWGMDTVVKRTLEKATADNEEDKK